MAPARPGPGSDVRVGLPPWAREQGSGGRTIAIDTAWGYCTGCCTGSPCSDTDPTTGAPCESLADGGVNQTCTGRGNELDHLAIPTALRALKKPRDQVRRCMPTLHRSVSHDTRQVT